MFDSTRGATTSHSGTEWSYPQSNHTSLGQTITDVGERTKRGLGEIDVFDPNPTSMRSLSTAA
jgi:hypothetical protein